LGLRSRHLRSHRGWFLCMWPVRARTLYLATPGWWVRTARTVARAGLASPQRRAG
jgi:hypothetical protein